MKLDKIRFAGLVNWIGRRGLSLDVGDIVDLDNITDVAVPEIPQGKADAEQLERLMFLMEQGTQKIEAIKQYRTLTGYELKESKDAVEKYWPVDKISVNKDRLLKNINDLSRESLDDRQIDAVYKYIEANIY